MGQRRESPPPRITRTGARWNRAGGLPVANPERSSWKIWVKWCSRRYMPSCEEEVPRNPGAELRAQRRLWYDVHVQAEFLF
jgi:hypothetical protein